MKSVVLSIAKLRAVWLDGSLRVPEIAKRFGIGKRTLNRIVREQGWPPACRRNSRARLSADAIRPYWNAGLRADDIGVLLGATGNAVRIMAFRAGMTRGQGWRPRISLADFVDQRAAEAMLASAVKTAEVQKTLMLRERQELRAA